MFYFSRLYWADVEKGTIESITLVGKDRRVVKKYGYRGKKAQFCIEREIKLLEDYCNQFGKLKKKNCRKFIVVRYLSVVVSGGFSTVFV